LKSADIKNSKTKRTNDRGSFGQHEHMVRLQHLLINDHFQNYKPYAIPKAQLVIADIPYNVGINAYGSNPFCSTLLVKEPKETGQAPCMVVFCAFDQQMEIIEKAKAYGLMNYIPLTFRKNFSAQVLKANMRIVGNCEYGLVLYRGKLPKFNNDGKMVFNCMDVERDTKSPKIHPTQKSVPLLEKLIKIFTDEGEVVIDPVAGSGTTIIAAMNCNRSAYGFEIKKPFFKEASRWIEEEKQAKEEIKNMGWAKTKASKEHPVLDFSVATVGVSCAER
jgi:site-specific DNA-methyltransferase (adenine-specific)